MRQSRVCSAIFASLLLVPTSAQSEDAVVVNATRFPESVARIPASVSVLTAADIAASAARTLPELLAEQVGITLKDFFGNNAALTSIDLRGYGVTGPQNTLILLDGRRISDIDLTTPQWSAIPLASIERIEILRGTGAVLYGDGASAGVINIVTRSPLRQGAHADAYGSVASYNTVEGQLHGSYASALFGINASVHGYSSDGYRANNMSEQQNNSLNLRWGLDRSTIDLRLATEKQDLRLPGARRIQPSIGLDEYRDDRRGAQTPLDYASRDGQRAGLALGHRIGEAELSLGLDYRSKNQRAYFDQAGFPRSQADNLEVSSLTPRLRIPFATGGLRHRLTLGADWHAWRYDSRRTVLPENLGQPINRVRASQDTSAFYLQDAIELQRATQLLLGWRDERVKFEATDTLDPSAPGFFFNSAAPQARETQRQHAWEIGLRHAFSGQWAAFARAGRSFRFVNVDEIYEVDATFSAQFQILRPQHAITQEAGAEWRSGPHALRGTVFVSEVRNEIHLDPFSTGVGNTNLPPSRRQGLELDGRWQLARTLRLSAGYAYTDARFLEGTLPGSPFSIGTNLDIAGKRVPLVPEHKLNLGMVWDIASKTRLSASLAYASSQYLDTDEPNTLGVKIPRYTVANLKLSHEIGRARVSLAVNNLLDEKYYTYAVRSFFVADRYAVYPLPGRTVAATLEVRLD